MVYKGTAPPKKEVDFEILDNLISIFCTGEECAAVLDVDYDTLNARIKDKYNILFSEYFKQKKPKAKASLRRTQRQLANKNPAMAIFLGKQYLDQKDGPAIDQSEHTHYNFTVNKNYERKENRELHDRLVDKTNSSV